MLTMPTPYTRGIAPEIVGWTDMLVSTAHAYAERREWEQRMEDQRPAEKRDAILRLMEQENPLTHKPHSASSAESVVETDAGYARYRRQQRDATVATIIARAEYEAARVKAWAAAHAMEDAA